ncbi:MAG: hypothetical protein LAO79_15630 [Acidobacteriia bacterium]|nr:hypothetical protein [Terriglobia bacterium]
MLRLWTNLSLRFKGLAVVSPPVAALIVSMGGLSRLERAVASPSARPGRGEWSRTNFNA